MIGPDEYDEEDEGGEDDGESCEDADPSEADDVPGIAEWYAPWDWPR